MFAQIDKTRVPLLWFNQDEVDLMAPGDSRPNFLDKDRIKSSPIEKGTSPVLFSEVPIKNERGKIRVPSAYQPGHDFPVDAGQLGQRAPSE